MINNPNFFLGVIEDIQDPRESNRVRCRVLGHHTEDLTKLPTESLPWMNVTFPVTSASMSSIGSGSHGLLLGSWVFGVFIDPENQQGLVLGSLASESTYQEAYDPNIGFRDPSEIYPLSTRSDAPALTQTQTEAEQSSSYHNKINNRYEDIPVATPPHLSTITEDSEPENEKYSTPDAQEYAQPVYPYNKVIQTESGHTQEYDDTPGKERISQTHRSGTSQEIIADGTSIHTIVGNGYKIVAGENNVYIVGNCNITVDGDMKTLVGGNYDLEVEGDMNMLIHGNRKTKISADCDSEIIGKRNIHISKGDTLKVGESQNISITDDAKFETLTGGQVINIKTNRNANVGLKDIHNVGEDYDLSVTGNRNDSTFGDSGHSIFSSSNLKITCPEKTNLSSPVLELSGDIIAGNAGVSLITHSHVQQAGNDAGAGADTIAPTPGTGVGS